MLIDVPAPHEVRHFLERACAKGSDIVWDDVPPLVEAKHVQLWRVNDPEPIAALATSINVTGDCCIWLCGGERVKDWFGFAEEVIGDFAKRSGANRLTIWGRKGWARMLPHWTNNDGVLELSL